MQGWGRVVFALTLGLAALDARAEEAVRSCSRAEADGARTLCHEIEVPASPGESWMLWSTSEGLSSWAAPLAAIDLRVGGLWEASYQPGARAGDPANIRNRVLSYVPGRMLSIAVDRAPPGFPHADIVGELWTVIEFEPVDAEHTRVRVTMLGYREGAGFDALYAHFDRGNAWTLQKFHERVTRGPVDWAALTRAPANAGDVR